MANQKLVSVIIPSYNAEAYIEQTIQSVLGQSHANIELIAINDGSTDNTLDKLNEVAKTDIRITVLTKDNSGVCDTRNLGMEKATGQYITFLDADDLWESTFLEECMKAFEADSSIQAVYSKVQLIDADSNKLDEFIDAKSITSPKDVLAWKKGYVASMGCTVYATEIAKQAGLFDRRLSTAADQDFHLRVAALTPIVAMGKVLFYYRIHGNNMHANIDVMEKDHILVFKKAEELGLYESYWFKKRCFATLYFILAGSWWKNGQNKLRGIYFLVRSFFSHPIEFFNRLLS